jgi:hypothetical protein
MGDLVHLGKDVLGYLLEFVPARDALAIGATCSQMHALSSKNLLWKYYLKRDFEIDDVDTDNYYGLYKLRFRVGDSGHACQEIFYDACSMGDEETALLALELGPASSYYWSIVGLVQAAKNGHLDLVRQLRSTDKLYQYIDTDDAFRAAAEGGHLETLQLLMDDEDIVPDNGYSRTLWDAADNGQINVVRYLLNDDRVALNGDDGWQLFYTLRNGHYDIVRLFLDDGRVSVQHEVFQREVFKQSLVQIGTRMIFHKSFIEGAERNRVIIFLAQIALVIILVVRWCELKIKR